MNYKYLMFVFALLSLAVPVNSTLSCEVAASCGYTTIFKISDPEDGHAEIADESNYNNLVCCREVGDYFIGTGCSGNNVTLLKLSGNSNAHAELVNESNYNVNVCVNTTMSSATITYATSCTSYDTCIASVSGNSNAHVGNCTTYSTKICATAQNNPVEISFVSPTEPNRVMSDRNYTYINVTTINASSVYIDWNNSLVGYWNFDNATSDLSSYGNNGTQNGGVDCSKTTLGRILYACRFDGVNDYVKISDAASLNLTSAYTIETWINLAGFNSSILDKDNGYALGVNASGFLYVWHNGVVINSTSNISLGIWYHIAATYNGSVAVLYVNGSTNATSTGSISALAQTARDLYIGVNNSANTAVANTYFKGVLDEVRLWNRGLSAREISASYNASATRLERNFTDLNDGVYNYYAVAIGAVGNRNTTETRNVTVRLVTPLITRGNNSAVGTENYQSSNLTVTFYQPSVNLYASSVKGRIWVETNAGVFDGGHDCISNSNGNCTIEFLPTCDYIQGLRKFRGGVFGDSVYNLSNSTDGFITIDTTAYCLNKVSFSLEFNISDSQNDHAEVDNKTAGLYRPGQLANHYACLEDTSLENSPAFGIVFSGRTLDYINLTGGNSYMMKMSQHQTGNKFLIPVTRDGCPTIRNKMNIIQTFGIMTQPFAAIAARGGNPIEVSLSYPGIDIIGNITKSGTFTLNIEKNESNGIVQMIFRD